MLLLNKNSIFYEIIIIVFQFIQCAIENRSACHAWHACRRLPTPGLVDKALEELTTTVCPIIELKMADGSPATLVHTYRLHCGTT
jgi:hypothetical protein